MIDFACPKCGAAMSAPDSLAGQTEACSSCGNATVVPQTQAQPQPTAAPLEAPQQAQQAPRPAPAAVAQPAAAPAGKSVSGLGIAALVLGVIAAAGCWIPFLNVISIVLAAVGLLLAVTGAIVSLTGRKSRIGMSVAGGCICLVAIVVAVAVTALAGGAVVSGLAGIQNRVKIDATKLQIAQAVTALDTFNMHMGRYPTEQEGLSVLLNKPEEDDTGAANAEWRGPYLPDEPKDAWHQPLNYQPVAPGSDEAAQGLSYKLWSNGPDGKSETDDDIRN